MNHEHRTASAHDATLATTSGPSCDREPLITRGNCNSSFVEILAKRRAAFACGVCGLSTVRENFGSAERPVLEKARAGVHCACVGGPAYAGIGSTLASVGGSH